MGNAEGAKDSERALNDSQYSSPSMKTSSQKSFRVSFGKTIGLSQFGKEKPRFDIVPNEMICITEATQKRHMSPTRNFDIISNEPKAYSSDRNAQNVEKSPHSTGQSPSLAVTHQKSNPL